MSFVTERKSCSRTLGLIWGVADFAEDGGTASAGGAGQIRRSPVQSSVCEQRENKGLLGVAGQAERIGSRDFKGRERGGELRQDQRITRSAAGDEQLRNRPSF